MAQVPDKILNTKQETDTHCMTNVLRQRLLSIKQSAEYMGMSPATIKELLYGREIKCIQRGNKGKVWIDRKELDGWIDKSQGYM